jgi:zinc protease
VGHLLFPKTHPYYGNVIGSHADVEAARLLDVRDFFQHYYTPNNASIAIVGDFDAATIKEKIAKFFGPIPKGPAVEKVNVVTPRSPRAPVTVTDTVQLPRLSVAWLTPEAFHPATRMRICSSMFWAAARSAGFTRSWCMRSRLRRA